MIRQKNLIAGFISLAPALFFTMAADQAEGQTLTPAEEEARTEVLEKEEAKSRLAIYGWIETGFTGNPAGPSDTSELRPTL